MSQLDVTQQGLQLRCVGVKVSHNWAPDFSWKPSLLLRSLSGFVPETSFLIHLWTQGALLGFHSLRTLLFAANKSNVRVRCTVWKSFRTNKQGDQGSIHFTIPNKDVLPARDGLRTREYDQKYLLMCLSGRFDIVRWYSRQIKKTVSQI